jgi:hypothetical protein
VLIPVCSRNQIYTNLDDTPIVKTFLPSFWRTCEKEEYQYTIYVGVDNSDIFYMNRLSELLAKNLYPIVLHGCEHKPAKAWNYLLEAAIEDGCEYFYQTGDDVEMLTENWTTSFIKELQTRNNMGITGPYDKNSHIMRKSYNLIPEKMIEQAFFHKKHHDIFGYLFYPEIDNHYCDNWLMQTYMPFGYATILDNIECNNSVRDVRYVPKFVPLIKSYILEGRNKVVISAFSNTPK